MKIKITVAVGSASDLNCRSLKFWRLKRSNFVAVWCALFLFLVLDASAEGVYSHWVNKTGGSVPESSVGAAIDNSTNVYVLGRFYFYTNRIGNTTLTNLIAVSNLFLAKFTGG